jgi:hypothetical protein
VAGDRANENSCKSVGNVWVTCPAAVTPGAVVLYYPSGGCMATGNSADTYIFSGYQYNWIALYQPSGNSCSVTLGAQSNSAYVGMFYAPGAAIAMSSPYLAEAVGTGGTLAGSVSFTGTLPRLVYSSQYAPVPPAARLIG